MVAETAAVAAAAATAAATAATPRTQSVVEWLKSEDAKRLATWVAFAALVVGLRGFGPVVIGTFLLSLVGNQSVDAAMRGWSWVQKRLIPRLRLGRLPGGFGSGGKFDVESALLRVTKPPRKAFVAAYIVSVLAFITATSVALVPRVIKEGQYVVARISQSSDPYLYMAESLHDVLGEDVLGKVETFITAIASGKGAQSITDQIFSQSAGVSRLRSFVRSFVR